MKRTRRVWGIWYTIRANSKAKWSKRWTGPIGVYGVDLIPLDVKNRFAGRPFVFTTRKQAREMAEHLDEKSNRTWTWVKRQVRPITMTWEW